MKTDNIERLATKISLLYDKTSSKVEHGCIKPYFLKNGRISVVLVMSKDGKKVLARGLAACDFDDKINKPYGISLAKKRAMRKLLRREKGDLPIVNPRSKRIFSGTGFDKKVELNPKLTDVEKTILQYI